MRSYDVRGGSEGVRRG